LIHFSAFFKFK